MNIRYDGEIVHCEYKLYNTYVYKGYSQNRVYEKFNRNMFYKRYRFF